MPKRTRRGGLRKAQGSGYSDHELDIMLRVLPQIPRDLESENESWKQMTRRRTRLAEKLRETAEAVADDPDLKELSFDIRANALDGVPPESGMVTLAQLLLNEAQHQSQRIGHT